jgi:TetR/AcrR family transcriptional regulator
VSRVIDFGDGISIYIQIIYLTESERSFSNQFNMNATFLKLSKLRQNGILDAAATVFANNGYHGANIPEICSQAGISVGALYKYFNNKEAVFIAVLQRMGDLLANEFYGKIQINKDSILATIEDILKAMTFTREFQQYRQYFILYLDIGSYSLNGFAESISDRFENIGREFYYKLVNHFKQSGQIRNEINTDHAAYLIDSYATLYAYTLVSKHHLIRFDRFFKNVGDTLTNEQRIGIVLDSIKMIL